MKRPHSITIVTPSVTTNSRGEEVRDYTVPPATTTTHRAWLQQDSAEEALSDGRDKVGRKWLAMIVSPGLRVTGIERVVWTNSAEGTVVFEVWGPGEPAYTGTRYHHHELTLRRVDG